MRMPNLPVVQPARHPLHDVMDRFLIHENAPPIFIGDASYQKYYKIVNGQKNESYFLMYFSSEPIVFIDIPDLFQSINIRLIDAFNPSAAAIVAAGTELAVNAAGPP